MMNHRYHINLFWSQPDGCWIADVPDLPGCSAHGDSVETAAAEAQVAIDLWLESAREHGDLIPTPRYRPAIYAARAEAA
jgi:predicted RNase H-like HicB family nuclease